MPTRLPTPSSRWLPPCRDPQPRAAVPPPGASSRRTDPSVPLSAQRCAAHGRDAHAARTQRAAAARVADLLPQRLHPRPLPGGHGGAGRARRGAAERHVCDADGRPRAAADDPVRRPAGAGEGRRGTVRRAATDRRGTAGLARRHHWQGAAAPQRAVSRHAGRSADGLARAAARDRDAAACRGHAGIRRGSHHGGAVALAGAVRAHRARGVVRRLGRHRQRVGRSPRDCRRGRAAARQRNAGGDRRRDPVAGARPGATHASGAGRAGTRRGALRYRRTVTPTGRAAPGSARRVSGAAAARTAPSRSSGTAKSPTSCERTTWSAPAARAASAPSATRPANSRLGRSPYISRSRSSSPIATTKAATAGMPPAISHSR